MCCDIGDLEMMVVVIVEMVKVDGGDGVPDGSYRDYGDGKALGVMVSHFFSAGGFTPRMNSVTRNHPPFLENQKFIYRTNATRTPSARFAISAPYSPTLIGQKKKNIRMCPW